jgi:hypothetical protein
MAAVTVALAAGPTVLGQPSLFRLFYYHVPAFDGVRATARLAVPALLVGALLAAVGLDALLRRLSGRASMLVAAGAGAFLLLELAVPVPKERLDVSPQAMAVYDELRERPDGIVAELPIIDPTTQPDEWGYVEGPRMARATTDWKPRVNGYSGAWPDDYVSILRVLNRFPSASALDRMDDLGVRYVVLHVGPAHFYPQLTEAQAQRIVDNLPDGASAERVGEAWLIDLGPSAKRDAAGQSRD